MRYKVLYTAPWYPSKWKVMAPFIQKHAKADSINNDVAVLAVVLRGSPLRPRIRIEFGEHSESFSEVIVYAPCLDLSTPKWLRPIAVFERGLAYFIGYLYIKRKVWRGERPDLCHVNVLTEAAALPWILKKIAKIPYVITEHWSRYGRPDGGYPVNRFHDYVTRRFVADADALCPVSENLKQAMRNHGLVNEICCLVGNVVDTKVFSLGEKQDTNHPFRFCHLSWFRDDSKNVSGILRSLHELAKVNREWEMTMIGDGNDRMKLETFSEELGLSEKVHFVGAYEGLQLADLLRSQDCLVMFSYYENQCVSVLEALACGLPVISSAVGEIPQMLADGRGLCVDAGDEQQLSDALRTAIGRNWTTDAEARHQYVEANHSCQVVAGKFHEIYESLLAK